MSKLTWFIWTDNEDRLIHSASSCCVYNEADHMEYTPSPRYLGRARGEGTRTTDMTG